MNKTSLLVAALAATAGLQAAEEPKSNYSVTTDFTYASEYVFRGAEQAGNSFQPSVEITSGNVYGGIWMNNPVTKQENNELDLYAGYKHKVNDKLSIEAVGTYYWYPEATKPGTKHSYEVGVGSTYTASGISLSANYYYDIRLEADTVQGSVGYSVPLEAVGASVDFSLFAGTVDARDAAPDASGPKVRESYNYYGADVSLVYKLNDKASITTGVHYADNQNLAGVGGSNGVWSDNNLWITAGLSVGF